tara:strand:- start:361 stop:1401 length:1041 start_codon:yes stop_codon:yes gene_type:complete
MAESEDIQADIVLDGMPGADPVTEEQVEKFQVDLNFEQTDLSPEGEQTAEAEIEEEEVEFPTEEVIEEEEVEAQAVEEEVVEEEVPEEEVEAQAEEEVEVEAEEEEPEKPKSPMVPKARLDEVLAKNKVMQKKITEFEEKEAESQAEAPQYDFGSKETEYQQLVLEGEAEKAVVLRTEIRNAEREQVMFEMKKEMGQTVQVSQEERELAAKAQELQEVFPIFDENSADYDSELTDEVVGLRDAFAIQGYGAADALAKATDVVLQMKKPELLQTEEPDAAPKQALQQKRQKATVKKKIAAAQSQPPELQGESASQRGEKSVDVQTLSDDEFGALPEETLRRLRGDFG